MSKPKIVVFWGKLKRGSEKNAHPLKIMGKKLPEYMKLLDKLVNSGCEVYLSFGYENYLGKLNFNSPLFYDGKNFKETSAKVKADAVYDRSAKMSFPNSRKIDNKKVINSNKFKKLCNNKWQMYETSPGYFPKTYFAKNEKKLHKLLKKIDKNTQYVIKPSNSFGGKGIEFGKPGELYNYTYEKPASFVIQEFMETKDGIPGLVKGRHDLRVTIIDGEIVWVTIRQPKKGNKVANVSKGGSIKEIPIEKLPKSIMPIIDEISKTFKEDYNNPLFSIDFGFSNGKPFIYEVNDQIGFPLPEMKENTLVESLAELLLKKASL